MPIKNYSTTVPATRTMSQITQMLVRKGATHVMTEYDEAGEPSGLKWGLNSRYGRFAYALPVNYDAIFDVLTNDGINKRNPKTRMEKAQRVAWRILKDWIESQIALMESGMVQMEEVFLPYMLTGDTTMYEALASSEFRALPSIGRQAIPLQAPADNPCG